MNITVQFCHYDCMYLEQEAFYDACVYPIKCLITSGNQFSLTIMLTGIPCIRRAFRSYSS